MNALPPELTEDAVKARFAWARRNGYSRWLWPDVEIEAWRQAMTEIVGAARAIMAGKVGRLEVAETAALSVAAYTSCMGPLLGHWIATGVLQAPDPAKEILTAHLDHNRVRMEKLLAVAKTVTGQLVGAGLHPLLFKGMHTAYVYFPDPAARSVTDIDICLPPSEIAAASALFGQLGFRPDLRMRAPYMCDWTLPGTPGLPLSLAWLHRDDPWKLDVQGSLDRRLSSGQRVYIDRLTARSAPQAWPPSPLVLTPGQPQAALQLAAHLSQDLHNVTLLRVCELVLVLRRDIPGQMSWNEFLDAAKRIGGLRFVYPALFFCAQLAPDVIPPAVLAACFADAPLQLRRALERLELSTVQPIARHAFSDHTMWVAGWRSALGLIGYKLGFFGPVRSLRPIPRNLYSKYRILVRKRLSS